MLEIVDVGVGSVPLDDFALPVADRHRPRLEPAESTRPVSQAHLGVEIRAANARLQELCKVVVSVYGPNAQAAFTFQKVAEGVQRLCQDLQAQASRDLPGYPTDGFYL